MLLPGRLATWQLSAKALPHYATMLLAQPESQHPPELEHKASRTRATSNTQPRNLSPTKCNAHTTTMSRTFITLHMKTSLSRPQHPSPFPSAVYPSAHTNLQNLPDARSRPLRTLTALDAIVPSSTSAILYPAASAILPPSVAARMLRTLSRSW